MMRERRRSPRVVLKAEIIVQTGDQPLTCRAGDVSTTGMLFYAPRPLNTGRLVRIRLRLPGQTQWLLADAVFVRVASERHIPHAYAVEFLRQPPQTEAALKQLTSPRSLSQSRLRRAAPMDGRALEQLYREALAAVDAADRDSKQR
jgi:hypothetical protein